VIVALVAGAVAVVEVDSEASQLPMPRWNLLSTVSAS
jgi:hypothetical protein